MGICSVKKHKKSLILKKSDRIILNKINPAYEYLKKENKMSSLVEFLKNKDLRQAIAVVLLPYYEGISVNVLEEIEKENIPHKSFKASIVLREWKKNSKKSI